MTAGSIETETTSGRKEERGERIPATISLALILCTCAFLSGCKGKPSWTAEVPSPDGKIIAKARTFDNGEFGTDFVETTVDLNFTKGKQSPLEILAFSNGPNAPGGMNVGMNWLSPTHLELTYKGQGPPDFQADRYYGVEITVRNLAGQAANTSKP